MKTLLVLIHLTGIFLSVESACDMNECIPPAATAQTCSSVGEYIRCMEGEKSGCTDAMDTMEAAINTVLETTQGVLKSLGCSTSGCDAASCTPTSVTSCSAYKIYLDCLEGEKKKCSDADTINSGLITTAMTTAETARKALQCSGVMVKLSVSTLILSLFAFYLRP